MESKQDQAVEQDQAQTEDQAIQQDQQNPTIESKIEEMENRYKAELRGLNKKVSDLAKEKEALEMEKLSETEKAEAIRKKAMEEAEQIKQETESLRRERDLTKVLYEAKLDPNLFSGRIKGETAEEMAEDAKALNEAINKEVEARLEKELVSRLSGKKPEGGKEVEKLSFAEQIKRARALSDGRRIYK